MSRERHLDCDGNNRTHLQAEQVMLVVIDHGEEKEVGGKHILVMDSTNVEIAELAGISVNEIGGVFRHMSKAVLRNGDPCLWMGSPVKAPNYPRVFTASGSEKYIHDALAQLAFAGGMMDRLSKMRSECERFEIELRNVAEMCLKQDFPEGFYVARKMADEIRVQGFPSEVTLTEFQAVMSAIQ